MTQGKELTTYESAFPMIATDNSSIIEAMKNNLENEEMTKRDMFTVIPNPSGGAEEWSFKTPAGRKMVEGIDCVILYVGSERALFEGQYEEGSTEPPLCSSSNGKIGVGDPGGRCSDCPEAEFGPDNIPPRCTHKKPIYILAPEINPIMPVMIYVTGPSFGTLKKYNIDLMHWGINIFDVKTSLSLKKGKTKNNRPASIIQFEPDGNIKDEDAAAYAKLVAYRDSLMPFINPEYKEIQKAADNRAA